MKLKGVWDVDERILYVLIVLVVLAIAGIYFFKLYTSFSIGDIVFQKNNPSRIGEVTGTSFYNLNYLVKWQNGDYTSESLFSISKINNFDSYGIKILNQNSTSSSGSPLYGLGAQDNLSDKYYSYEKEGAYGNASALFYTGRYGSIEFELPENCEPDYSCSGWGECHVNYDISSLIDASSFQGLEYRYCKDNNKCLPDIVESRSCDDSTWVNVSIVDWCGEENIQLSDSEGIVSARLNDKNQANYMDININLGTSYCAHCYNGVKDRGETGVDCGGECKKCYSQ